MMGVAVIPARLCAICADQPGTRSTVIGYRVVMACRRCRNPEVSNVEGIVDDERRKGAGRGRKTPMRDSVVDIVRRNPGIASSDLNDMLIGEREGDPIANKARNALTVLVRRMADEGILRREEIRYAHGKQYQIWLAGDRGPA